MENSSTTDNIEHWAEIISVSIDKKNLEVRIFDRVECCSCPAEDLCSLSHKKDKRIIIPSPIVAKFKLGDKIIVRGQETLPKNFLLVATLLPCIILVTSMTIVYLLTYNQGMALICGVGITLILFILIWTARNRVIHEFNFSIIGHKKSK